MTRLTWGACVMGTLGAMGCTDGEDLLLGRAQRPPDAGAESPAQDAGEPETADGGVDRAEPEQRHCDPAPSGSLPVELRIEFAEPSCTDSCQPHPDKLRIAPDGSIWLLVYLNDFPSTGQRLWLGHYDATGTLLGSAIVDDRGRRRAELAVDERGQAWLLQPDADGHATTLRRFVGSAHEVGAALLAGDFKNIVAYSGVGTVLALGSRPQELTALDFDGNLVWSRTDAERSRGHVAINGEGEFVVASPGALQGWTARVVLDWSKAGAEPPYQTTEAFLLVESYSWNDFGMHFDDAGQLTLTGSIPLPPVASGSYEPMTYVERVDPARGTLWRWEVNASPEGVATVDPRTGTTLVAAYFGGVRWGLAAISPDGSSCRGFDLDGPDWFSALAMGPNGQVWFAGRKVVPGTVRFSIGRTSLPEL